MDIDFVVTWVDGNDEEWLEQKKKYTPNSEEESINTEIRYRDYGTFKYWFRAVEKFAPWVHKIYVVTAGHKPDWLDIDSEKIVFVKHSDFIPEEYLPTFNSNPIELNLHRINNLSEHFVLFSDDVFLNKPVTKDDFFYKKLPRNYGVYSPVVPFKEFSNVVFNNVRMINRNFNKRQDLKKNFFKIFSYKYGLQIIRTICTLPWGPSLGYLDMHLTSSLLKSTLTKVWEIEYEELDNTSRNRFRTLSDINHWVLKYWQIESGKFYPQSISFGKKYTLNEYSKVIEEITNRNKKIICINDDYNVQNYEEKMDGLVNTFEKKYPEKSKFEL